MLFRDSSNYILKHDTPSYVPLTAGENADAVFALICDSILS